MRWTSVSLSVVLASCVVACAGATKANAPPTPKTSAIIFVPGYYGSSLKDARTDRRVFVTAGRYLFGGEPIGLFAHDLATPGPRDLVVDRVMDHVDILGGLIKVDVYGKFMTRLRRLADERGAEFVPFAYDWRADLSETARALDARVRALRARGVTDVRIVAHSMGCLVTAYYLGYGAQPPEDATLDWSGASQVGHVVLMAGPYRGAFSLFRNMQTGAKIGSNTSYLPAEAVASLPASYHLLPMLDFHLTDPDGQPRPFAVEDATAWDGLHLGLFRDRTLAPDVKARRLAFVDRQLKRARSFADRLEFRGDPPPRTLRVLQLVGHGIPVVDSGFFDPKSETFTFDTDKPEAKGLSTNRLFRDGDGSVTVRSAKLPAALADVTRVLKTTREHDKVFEDEDFVSELGVFLAR